MTATLISLLSILIGIIGANLMGFFAKKHNYDLVGNSIAGVFGSVFLIKSFGRLGFSPNLVAQAGEVNLAMLVLNLLISFAGGGLALFLVKKINDKLKKSV